MKFQQKRLIFIFVLSIFYLSGCTSMQLISPSHGRKKSYKLKTPYTTVTGKSMLTIYNTDIFPAYKAKYTYHPPYIYMMGNKLCDQMPSITPEQKWMTLYRKSNGNYIIYSETYNKLVGLEKNPIGIEIRPNGTLAGEEAWVHTNAPVEKAVQPLWDLPDPQLFEKTEHYVKEGPFKAELIYTGKMENIITVHYAEPTSFQELAYDLNKETVIKFKSIKIKVLQATSKDITFEVIDDGSLSWVPKHGSVGR